MWFPISPFKGRSTNPRLVLLVGFNPYPRGIHLVLLNISKVFRRSARSSAEIAHFGFCTSLLRWTSSFHSKLTILFLVDGVLSQSFHPNPGPPPGPSLAPTLLLSINNLMYTNSNPVHFLADDATLCYFFCLPLFSSCKQ